MSIKGDRTGTGPSFPTEIDFDRLPSVLESKAAWSHFGGLSISAALALFRDNPLYYQEDFMFMGRRAFVYYFPVLDLYLREFRVSEDEDESVAAIIGSGIIAQIESSSDSCLVPIHPAIRSLADYVCSHSKFLAEDPDEQARIIKHWRPIYSALESVQK